VSTRGKRAAENTHEDKENVQAVSGTLKHLFVENLGFVVIHFPNPRVVIDLMKQLIRLIFPLVILRD
jgi:hypothetical protein